MEEKVKKYVLQNALQYGKADAKRILGKVLGENADLRGRVPEVQKVIDRIVKEVNKMSADKIKAELGSLAPELLEKKVKEKSDLRELDNIIPGKQVVMRFAPSPSGPMHIGHAMTGGLTSLYTKRYGGKFILRIEDTNSDNIDPDAYWMLPKDGEWLFGNVSEVWIQSDRMDVYYGYAKKLIDVGAVYLCTCSQEDFKKYADDMEDCPCRNNSVEENLRRWSMMFDKKAYKEGDVVMRFKSGMQHPNPAMRDFPLMRINDSPHPRQGLKYRVWPLMNMSVTVDDIEAKMTHTIRAKDHMDNAKRQEMIYEALGLKHLYPTNYFVGRYNFLGLEISCSKTKARIKAGEFWGWDDIRLPFMQALKRRGYQAEAFLKYAKLTGLSQVDKTIEGSEFFKSIDAFNREIIDTFAKRFFFISDYETVKIEGAPKQTVELKAHPDHPELGVRKFDVKDSFLLSKNDLKDLKSGNLYRLMDCLNFVKAGKGFKFDSLEYEKYKDKGKKIMHFLPVEGNVDVEILMNDEKASVLKGLGEHSISALKVGDIVQFERFGFCRLDSVEEKSGKKVFKFWFTHK